MNKIQILIATTMALFVASTAYAASTQDEEATNPSLTVQESEAMPGMMGGMHGGGMMPHGMMGHHMMHSGMSPVTVLIYPGMMPMMGHGMMQRGADGGHKGGRMAHGKMARHHDLRQKHMDRMEQRLAKIEELLGTLIEELRNKDE